MNDPPVLGRWVYLTFLGWALGFLLMLLLIGVFGMIGLGETQVPIGLGMGAGVGLLQGRLIRERLGTGRSWLYACAAGLTAPFLVRDLAKLADIDLPYTLAGSVIVGGFMVGLLQWRVLRPLVSGAGIWIPASIVGWTLAASTVVLNDRVIPKTPGLVGALIYVGVILVGGVMLGALTGVVLQRLLRVGNKI